MRLSLEDVFRNIDQNRTGAARSSNVKRLVNDARQFVDVLHQVVVFGGRTRDAERIGFLKGITAHQLAGDLTREGDHGDGVHHGVH